MGEIWAKQRDTAEEKSSPELAKIAAVREDPERSTQMVQKGHGAHYGQIKAGTEVWKHTKIEENRDLQPCQL